MRARERIGSARTGLLGGVLVPALAAAVLLFGAAPATAQTDTINHDDQVVLNGRLEVPQGETIDNAVILNGPARIEGSVRETVFVLRGNAVISGDVGKNVVVVNGTAIIRSGAHVGGDVVTRTPPTIDQRATVDGRVRRLQTRFDLQGLGFASRLVWWIAYSASTLFLGLLLLLTFARLDAAVARVWRQRAGESIAFGVAGFLLVPIIGVLFLVTVVGIPLGVFLLLGLALLYTIGYVCGALVLGRLIVRPPTSRYLAFLVGWVILRAVGLVPIVGGLVWFVASLIGLGVLTVAARRPADAEAPSVVSAPPPPPPAMATA